MAPIPPKPTSPASEIYIDIETIPTQEKRLQEYIFDNISAPANYKDPEKIAAYIADAKLDALQKNSFDGGFCQIVCIGVARDDKSPITFIGDEKQILEDFIDWITPRFRAGTKIIGHNVVGFDLRVIRQRMIVNGIKIPAFIPFNTKPWDMNPFDTMSQWDAKNSTSMDKLAAILGIKGKQGTTGADVYPMWQEGRIDDIARYCESDVALTRKIYKRMVGAA